MGVTDLDELSELGTFAGKREDEARSPPCCYVDDGIDVWDPVMMAKELGCHMDELPVHYGGDLWNPDGSDFGYLDYYDDQSELSDYEDPWDFFRDEWLGSCEHAPDGSYFDVPEVRKASSPVSGYTPGIDVEVSVTPMRLQQDSGDASVSAMDVTSGPEVDFGPPLLSGFGGCICFGGGCYFWSGSLLFGHGPLGVVVIGVVLGVAVVLYSPRTRTHCHLFLPARDRI